MTGNVLQLPGAASAPVQNRLRPGRYPRGVASLRQARRRKQRAAAEAMPQQAPDTAEGSEGRLAALYELGRLAGAISQSASTGEIRPDLAALAAVPGHPVGTRLLCMDGGEVTVTGGLKLWAVRDEHGTWVYQGERVSWRYGYLVKSDNGAKWFVHPYLLFDLSGARTHLRLAHSV